MLATQVSVEEYLKTSYDPDRDYVDGVLEERNLGQTEHGRLQGLLIVWFWQACRSLGIRAIPELRIRVKPNLYRIPDVLVIQGPVPNEPVVTSPPYICIEVLSPEDRFGRMQHRVDDYISFGVPNIWIIDPIERRAWFADRDGIHEAANASLKTSDGKVTMPLADVYALDA